MVPERITREDTVAAGGWAAAVAARPASPPQAASTSAAAAPASATITTTMVRRIASAPLPLAGHDVERVLGEGCDRGIAHVGRGRRGAGGEAAGGQAAPRVDGGLGRAGHRLPAHAAAPRPRAGGGARAGR